ncbi:MAG: hypothetical protein HETSPECPRED_007056 [Heterodermia speciosa]|uniref:Asl1-like glycosyl hydrolase catalytic domain-containing protein n=1 Tax=Heterodermia speciosa TaxID=116794 RepID=A0A8H3I6X6_9LECA|nr:MAG: hypothetical protein HETSPECPRED_007056 [Heterodermia speciosa]
MTRFSPILAALLAPAALAIPKSPAYAYGQPNGYGLSSKVTGQPTALPTAIPHPSGVPQSGGSLGPIGSSTAPFGFTNSTAISGPTGTGVGTGSLSLPSIVTVVPIPESSAVETGSETTAGQPSATGNSPIGASSGAGECGPATVTVTSASTFTVTVGAGPISSAEESSPISASSINSAPYPIGNVTTAGPTGTGTVGTVGTVVSLPIESSAELPLPVYTGLPSSTAVSSTNTLAAVGGVSSSVAAHGYHHLSLHKHHSTSTAPVYVPESSSSSSSSTSSTPSSSVVVPVVSVPAPSSTPSTSSVQAVPTTPTSIPAYSTPSTTTTSTPTSTPTSSPSTSGGDVVPRGLVYNTAALTSLFAKDTIGWAYNWDSQPGGTVASGLNFVPMLWSTNSDHLPNWESNVNSAISNGATHILGFNEPDLGAQANMSPEEAAGAWDNLEKFGDKVKIGSPAVCNGGGATGLNWLTKFLSACSGCQVDFIAIHWYGDANEYGIEALKQHIKDTQALAAGRPIWLTEFQPSGSVEQQADFMNTILPYLDDQSNGVERYAYFEVDGVLTSGGSLTELGSKYVA